MHVESFPYLENLLGGYFHQDCYDDGATDEDILKDFSSTSHDYERLGVRADIHRLLHQHGDQLLDFVQHVFQPNIIIGESNENARDWFLRVAKALEDSTSSR